MSNRKKYITKLIKIENLRKKRLKKKLKRKKIIAGRKKIQLQAPAEKKPTAQTT